MRLLRRRSASAVPPARLIALVPGSEPVLGAVPLDRAGRGGGGGPPPPRPGRGRGGAGWGDAGGGGNRGAWDAEARTFTLELLGGTEPLTLTVPDRIRGAERDGELAVEERAFAVALRQRITAAIIHQAGCALPSGRRATASVRRRADGSLYSVTDPPLGEDGALDADDVDALLALERRVRDGVGLTTS